MDPDTSEPVRAHVMVERKGEPEGATLELERAFNKCLERVEDSFKHFNFNTAVAGFMEFLNLASKNKESMDRDLCERFVCVMAPFAPHLCEELWSRMGHTDGVARAPWPAVRKQYLVQDDFELVVQVMGKIRGRTRAPMSADKAQLESLARSTIEENLEGKTIVKTIVVPGRLVNFVVR